MPSSNFDGSKVVLFLDETSHNLRFISGPFSLSDSRCRGKVGIDATHGTTRLDNGGQKQREARDAF